MNSLAVVVVATVSAIFGVVRFVAVVVVDDDDDVGCVVSSSTSSIPIPGGIWFMMLDTTVVVPMKERDAVLMSLGLKGERVVVVDIAEFDDVDVFHLEIGDDRGIKVTKQQVGGSRP